MAVTENSGLTIDASDFRNLSRALKESAPALRLEMNRELRLIGEIVAEEARAIVSEYSESIPPTIKVSVRMGSIAVQAGGTTGGAGIARALFEGSYGTSSSDRSQHDLESDAEGVAIAGLFELGNKGHGKTQTADEGGSFRHPLFGKDVWVEQPMHPFLLPAQKAKTADIDAGLARVAESTAKKISLLYEARAL